MRDVFRADAFGTWLRWQAPYMAFAYAYFPVTLINRVLLKRKRAYIGLDPIVRRFWDKWGWLGPELSHVPGTRQPVWINMNSGGEVVMSLSLLKQLDLASDDYVLSTESYDSFELLSRTYGGRVFFPPWDTALSAGRSLSRVSPRAMVFVQNAYFPVLLSMARRRGARTVLVNGLLSRNVDRGNPTMDRSLALGFYRQLDAIAVQTDDDANAFVRLGVAPHRIEVTGDIATDLAPLRMPADRRNAARADIGFAPTSPVFIAASTHPPERHAVVEMLLELRRRIPETRFIVAPRQIHEAWHFTEALTTAGFRVLHRTGLLAGTEDASGGHDVLLLDTFGELRTMYALADVAFIGSSLVRLNERGGGHNPLEALVHGTIPVFGPYMNLWPAVVAELNDVWPGVQVESAAAVARAAEELLSGRAPIQALRKAGTQRIERSAGAVDRTVAFLRRELSLL